MSHTASRFIMVVTAMATACIAWAQAIFFDGHKAVHDSSNNIWLCCVPQEVFGQDWMPVVTFDSIYTSVIVNDVEVLNGDTITIHSITGGKLFPMTLQDEQQTLNGNVTFTWLPLLELKGQFGNEYAQGTVSLYTPDASDDKSDMLAKLKWRGGITNTPDKHKRNYHIKFIDENGEKKNRRMLGMRKDNHWKLDAGQMDPLRIRNRVCSDLWLDMSRDPWYIGLDSTVVNGSHGRLTEVILNGEYYGIYNLMEPVDRKQLALVKHDTVDNVFHGQQWVSKTWASTYALPPYNNYSTTWNGNEVNYPEVEDVFPTDWSVFYNAFNFAKRMDAVDNWQTLGDSIGYYYDVPVLHDYIIFIITLQALDNEVKNIYYSCYDKQESQLLTVTPWDLDISLGAKSIPNLEVSPERPVNWITNLAMGDLFKFARPHRKQIIERYWQLRETWLNTDSLLSRFQRAVDELESCGAAAREEARWSMDTDLGGSVLDISNEMEYIADWITRRMAYLDENVFAIVILRGDANDDGKLNIDDVTSLINHLLNNEPVNETNADVDADGYIDISDVTQLINILLNGN